MNVLKSTKDVRVYPHMMNNSNRIDPKWELSCQYSDASLSLVVNLANPHDIEYSKFLWIDGVKYEIVDEEMFIFVRENRYTQKIVELHSVGKISNMYEVLPGEEDAWPIIESIDMDDYVQESSVKNYLPVFDDMIFVWKMLNEIVTF